MLSLKILSLLLLLLYGLRANVIKMVRDNIPVERTYNFFGNYTMIYGYKINTDSNRLDGDLPECQCRMNSRAYGHSYLSITEDKGDVDCISYDGILQNINFISDSNSIIYLNYQDDFLPAEDAVFYKLNKYKLRNYTIIKSDECKDGGNKKLAVIKSARERKIMVDLLIAGNVDSAILDGKTEDDSTIKWGDGSNFQDNNLLQENTVIKENMVLTFNKEGKFGLVWLSEKLPHICNYDPFSVKNY